jgi:hypothetical protein
MRNAKPAGAEIISGSGRGCGFCGLNAPLHDSHVLPAFVYRWLKGGSGTGHIRNTDNPNRRVQDGLKLSWLCSACEQKFSRYETAFATKVFHAWGEGREQLRYSDWLLKFCVSVSWRVLRFARGKNPDHRYTAAQEELMDQAEKRWRAFLNDDAPHPGAFEQHLLPLGIIESTSVPNLPKNFNRFLARAVTLDIVGSDRTLMTFAKLGPFTIFGLVQGNRREWAGSKIHVRDGTLGPSKYTIPAGVLGLLVEKASLIASAMDRMSEQQRSKIDQHIVDNVEAFLASDQFKAIEADARMFGITAVTRGPNAT